MSIASPAPPQADTTRKVYSVSAVVTSADRALRQRTGALWVRGEVSGWKRAASRHCYFTLKDDQAEIPCVLFAPDADLLPALPDDGTEVVVLGQIGIYKRKGQFQLTVTRVDATGAGGLWQLAVDRLRRTLRSEGLLDPSRKRPLPRCPDRIGIVTSAEGAALHDMFRALRRKAWWTTVVVSPCTVEGPAAAPAIAAAIRRFGPGACPVDVVLVARGGGSKESLWAFNLEEVARAIAACPYPVVSAVGHETDYTVADDVADHRAATPTAGPEHVVPEGAEIKAWLESYAADTARPVRRRVAAAQEAFVRERAELRRRIRRRTDVLGVRLDGIDRHLAARSPQRQLQVVAADLARAEEALHAAARRRTGALRAALDAEVGALHAAARSRVRGYDERFRAGVEALEARSPLGVLLRGYSVLQDDETGAVVRTVAQVRPGQAVRARVSDGVVRLRVDDPPTDPANG